MNAMQMLVPFYFFYFVLFSLLLLPYTQQIYHFFLFFIALCLTPSSLFVIVRQCRISFCSELLLLLLLHSLCFRIGFTCIVIFLCRMWKIRCHRMRKCLVHKVIAVVHITDYMKQLIRNCQIAERVETTCMYDERENNLVTQRKIWCCW